jgi:hypothetical protein
MLINEIKRTYRPTPRPQSDLVGIDALAASSPLLSTARRKAVRSRAGRGCHGAAKPSTTPSARLRRGGEGGLAYLSPRWAPAAAII